MVCRTPRLARSALRGRIHAVGSWIAIASFLTCLGGCASTRVEPLTSQTDPAQLDPGERALWETADRLEGQIASYV